MAQDAALLRAIVPDHTGTPGRNQDRIIDEVGAALVFTLAEYQINTPLRAAHFLAQIAHEADGLVTTEEYASGEEYEGRKDLGNVNPGDGPRYKGRGLIQLTGRANYQRFGKLMGLDLENQPLLAGDPVTSLRIACEYWKDRKINEHADYDDLRTVTFRVNGGQRGYDDRKKYLAKAKQALNFAPGPLPARPVLKNPVKSEQARALQVHLRVAGIPINPIDGDFGGGTERAVKAFQKEIGQKETGIADAVVWAELAKRV
jgi:putative chitinase